MQREVGVFVQRAGQRAGTFEELNKEYLRLHELLLKEEVALDAIDPAGDGAVRLLRKEMIVYIEGVCQTLEKSRQSLGRP